MKTEERIGRLAPPPRRAEARHSRWQVPRRLGVEIPAGWSMQGSPAMRALQKSLARHGTQFTPDGSPGSDRSPARGARGLRLHRDEGLAAEAYTLEIDEDGARLGAATQVGLSHGLYTLAQWVALHPRAERALHLEGLAIEDAPSLAERGVMLDVARDRRPTMETLFDLVTRLAALKINRLQLYMEADFAYSFGGLATRGRSPYSAGEIRRLDSHCIEHGIELVPNQQSFGHLHHWLRHDPWRSLAEVPAGLTHPFSKETEPFSLCPTDPGSLPFLERLFDELLPCFSSSDFNVGLDETFDIGQGRSREACAKTSAQRVYLDFLGRVHGLLTDRGKRMLFFGDIIQKEPELCAELPASAVAMSWGYEADHPFEDELRPLASSGRKFAVCPGTSSWNSFVGRTQNCLANIESAARTATRQGALGLLVCDWGDRGHLQPAPISAPGFVLAAALAWNAEFEGAAEHLATWLDDWWFEDAAGVLGEVVLELGRNGEVSGETTKNGTAGFFLCIAADLPLTDEHFEGLDSARLDAAHEHLQAVLANLGRARSLRDDGALVDSELTLARDLQSLGVDLGRARLRGGGCATSELDSQARARFAERLAELCTRHRELWPARARPGGLTASLAWLEALRPQLGRCAPR
jgi:hypothetical protein